MECNISTAAGSSSSRVMIDLTGNSDDEDDSSNVRLVQNSVTYETTSQQSNNQGKNVLYTYLFFTLSCAYNVN